MIGTRISEKLISATMRCFQHSAVSNCTVPSLGSIHESHPPKPIPVKFLERFEKDHTFAPDGTGPFFHYGGCVSGLLHRRITTTLARGKTLDGFLVFFVRCLLFVNTEVGSNPKDSTLIVRHRCSNDFAKARHVGPLSLM